MTAKTTTPAATPAVQPQEAAQPSALVASMLVRENLAKLAAAQVRRDALQADLAEARIVAEPAHRLRVMAEATWDAKSEDDRTVADAQRLEQRRAADDTAAKHVADLLAHLDDVDGEIAVLKESDTRRRAIALAEATWPPAAQALIAPVLALLPVLRAQRAAWETLVDAQATGPVDRQLELAIWGVGYSEEIVPELERWLAAMQRAGLADGKQ